MRPKEKGCKIAWDSLVLITKSVKPKLPRSEPQSAPESSAWLKSTACVQSEDPSIKLESARVGNSSDDVETYARKVIAFTSKNHGNPGEKFDSLDAKKALLCGGSCTSRANLAAALFRAHGIPARTVSHLPIYSGPLYEHWLVEYWHPGVGWIWIEPTFGVFEPSAERIVVLGEADPEDEEKAFDSLHCQSVMPGAPYLSVIELSQELKPMFTINGYKSNAKNYTNLEAKIKGTPTEIKELQSTAIKEFQNLENQNGATAETTARSEKIQQVSHSGIAARLIRALNNDEPVQQKEQYAQNKLKPPQDFSPSTEKIYKQQLEASQKKYGPTNPRTMAFMWEISKYYLNVQKYIGKCQ